MDCLLSCRTHWRELAFVRKASCISIPEYVFPSFWFYYPAKFLSPFPVIDAEVRYAVRHEYALSAIDVLARRTRLSFLNAHAALDALPRVVDVMADELNWSKAERKKQTKDAVQFLKSMGLSPAYMAHVPDLEPRGLWEKLWAAAVRLIGTGAAVKENKPYMYGRSKFEAGELAALRHAFVTHVRGAEKMNKADVKEVLKDVLGYAGISDKDYAYVFYEAGLKNKEELDFDEFAEVGFVFLPPDCFEK